MDNENEPMLWRNEQEKYIGYAAEVVLHEAKWTDKEGSTVTFRLPMHGMENQRNPFDKWTKRRKGHAGTRFMMACRHIAGQVPVYADEVMLAGWNDSQSNGHTVKFWLAGDQMGHPFEGFERNKHRFAVSLVEIDDDQQPIDQKVREKVEANSISPSQRTSYVAAMLCKNEGFWQWIAETEMPEWQIAIDDGSMDENDAKHWLCDRLGITSRAELDDSSLLTDRFHKEIRRPFLEWQGESE